MKRSIEFDSREFKKFKYENNIIENRYIRQPVISNQDFAFKINSYDLGTKTGMILASKMTKNIKIHGFDYVKSFFVNKYNTEIFDNIQDIPISNTDITTLHLKNNFELFQKYFEEFHAGFKQTFFQYLKLNLKNNPEIIHQINNFDIYKIKYYLICFL